MANLACDLPTVEFIGKAMDPCKEDFAGIGYIIYAVDPTDLIKKPEYVNAKGMMRFSKDSFDKSNFYKGKYAYKIICKKNNAQNQGTGNEGAGKGAAQSLTFTVENDIENAAYALRLMKNKGDFYFLCTKGEDIYQVVGDPTWGSNLNFNYDSGQEATSDSGLMATVSCPTAPSPVVFWMPKESDTDGTPAEEPAVLPTFNDISTSEQVKPNEA